ncbi:MAG: hypothetical protein LV481_11505 [Methylacidiphilales bacterium]|nr:hypothetical protein [Candidatus Methylacidiphilales bacterium]
MPKALKITFYKEVLLDELVKVDADARCRSRVLELEVAFRKKIQAHASSLLKVDAELREFNTSPFVLLIHAFARRYSLVEELENDILPAKQFSSMETSAGRMVEEVVLPVYGWQCVASEMHTTNSALDGRQIGSSPFRLATLKSGPRCLNDEMSENFADAVIANAATWAEEGGATELDFTYGVLYGTPKQSNKKDWHILRNLRDKLRQNQMRVSPNGRWDCECDIGEIPVHATIRIGEAWWKYLGGETCLTEVISALIRACIVPGRLPEKPSKFTISDFGAVVGMEEVPISFNVGLLQRAQIPWLFLIANHFCDELV